MSLIPKGKIITIGKGTKSVKGILDSEITFSLASNYTNLLDGLGASNIVSAVQKLGTRLVDVGSILGISGTKDASMVFKEASIPRWVGTEPLRINLSISFFKDQIKTKGKAGTIYNFAKELAKWILPSDGDSDWKGLKPPIPNDLISLVDAAKNYKTKSNDFVYIEIGNIINLKKVIIESGDFTFATDSTGSNKPIYIKLNLQIRTLGSATSNLITDGMR